jgi:hypothetical protein
MYGHEPKVFAAPAVLCISYAQGRSRGDEDCGMNTEDGTP